MSQWTHFSGVVRIETFNLNIDPPPPNQHILVEAETRIVNTIFNEDVPYGSEGPLNIQTILTGRGPTVVITGDLRDFGEEDVNAVLEWLNNCMKKVYDLKKGLMLRDGIINCDVEFLDRYIIIVPDKEEEFFKLEKFLGKEIE